MRVFFQILFLLSSLISSPVSSMHQRTSSNIQQFHKPILTPFLPAVKAIRISSRISINENIPIHQAIECIIDLNQPSQREVNLELLPQGQQPVIEAIECKLFDESLAQPIQFVTHDQAMTQRQQPARYYQEPQYPTYFGGNQYQYQYQYQQYYNDYQRQPYYEMNNRHMYRK